MSIEKIQSALQELGANPLLRKGDELVQVDWSRPGMQSTVRIAFDTNLAASAPMTLANLRYPLV